MFHLTLWLSVKFYYNERTEFSIQNKTRQNQLRMKMKKKADGWWSGTELQSTSSELRAKLDCNRWPSDMLADVVAEKGKTLQGPFPQYGLTLNVKSVFKMNFYKSF